MRRRRLLIGSGVNIFSDPIVTPKNAAPQSGNLTAPVMVGGSFSSAQMNAAGNAAIAAGADPVIVQTLIALGVAPGYLAAIANGTYTDQQVLAADTGPSPLPGQPVTASGEYPAADIPQEQNYGILSPGAISDVVGAADAVDAAAAVPGDFLGWVEQNWVFLAAGVIGIWWLSREL